jgi:isopenicillin N synthase-like dioxygenase
MTLGGNPVAGETVPYVPIIDISRDPAVVSEELDEVCRTIGFFQITGHGIDDGVADGAWDAATRFFDLPLEDKLSVERPTPDYAYGYIPVAGESLSQSMTGVAPADLKEVFNAGPVTAPRHEMTDPDEASVYAPNLWPAALPEMKEAWAAYWAAQRDLGDRLMALFARGLGLAPDFFAGKVDQAPNALRAINYPARDTAPLPGQLRAGAHTDYGTLTTLRQDTVGGLEVLDAGGNWAAVAPVPGAFVINIGDLMARWTNDRWRSTLHRVVDPPDADASRTRRQSMPYFQNANWSAEITCLPTCLAPGESPRYEPVLAGPHLMGKFRKSVKL